MKTRQPAAAGTFYPDNKQHLENIIAEFLSKAPKIKTNKKLKAIIVPHAGYQYSGQVAAYAYKQIKRYSQIIILGPSHRIALQQLSTDSNQYWQTPLGKVEIVDNDFAINQKAHLTEHSLEVQLPFLQYLLQDFQILPLLTSKQVSEKELEKITNLLDQKTLLVVSTDLSHYHNYQTAQKLDQKTIKAIESLNPPEIQEACGKTPLCIILEIALKKNWTPQVFVYKNSGDITGNKSHVVGYTSIGFYAH